MISPTVVDETKLAVAPNAEQDEALAREEAYVRLWLQRVKSAKRKWESDFKRMREAFGVPTEVPPSLFYEQYDTEPVIDIKDPAVVEPLKAALAAAWERQRG